MKIDLLNMLGPSLSASLKKLLDNSPKVTDLYYIGELNSFIEVATSLIYIDVVKAAREAHPDDEEAQFAFTWDRVSKTPTTLSAILYAFLNILSAYSEEIVNNKSVDIMTLKEKIAKIRIGSKD